MRPGRLLPPLAVLLGALPSLVNIFDPPARDQGVFAYVGWRWLSGDVPYLAGGMEHKGPLPFLAYALSFVLFGRTFLAARLLAWFSLLAAGWGVMALTRRVAPGSDATRNVTGAVAGTACVALTGLSGLSGWWSGAQAETFMEPLVVGSAVVFLARADRPGRRLAPVVLSGILLGLASLGKPTVFLMLPAFFAGGLAMSGLFPFLSGVAAPWSLTLAYFVLRGAGPAFLDSVITANFDYGSRGLQVLPRVIGAFPEIHNGLVNLRFLVPAAIGVCRLLRKPRTSGGLFLLAWTGTAYLQVLVQGRLFGYHFYPIVAPVAALFAIGMVTAWKTAFARTGGAPAPSPLLRWVSIAAMLVGLSGIAGFEWAAWNARVNHLAGKMNDTRFLSLFAGAGEIRDVDPAETIRAARWIETHSKADETLLVWGFEPAVNFLSKRKSPTRFIYDYFLTSRAVRSDRQERYWSLFWGDVTKSPPDWIAVVHNDVNPLEREDSAAQLRQEPRLRDWLEENYEPDTQVGDFEFYRRRVVGSGSTPGG